MSAPAPAPRHPVLQNFDAASLGASDLVIITSLLDKGRPLSNA